MEAFDNTVKNYTTWLDNQYVSSALTIFLIVYASMAAPKLPTYIASLFDYTIVKLLMFFMIVFISKKNATVALIASVALMVSIMTLDRIKFGQEMMEVVGNDESNENDCSCKRNKLINLPGMNLKSQTAEADLVREEIVKAHQEGSLSRPDAELLMWKVVSTEMDNMPILVAKTEEGAKRMSEIAQAEINKQLDEETAKKMVAKIVVQESIAEMSNTYAENKNVSNEEHNLTNADVAIVQEVMQRKQEETDKRGGVPLSKEELQMLCSSVLDKNRNRRRKSCGSNCDVDAAEVVPSDDMDSDYASIEQSTLGLEKRMEQMLQKYSY